MSPRQKPRVFDINCHFTLDGSYLAGYKNNLPANLDNYLTQAADHVEICGLVCTCLPGLTTNSEATKLERLLQEKDPRFQTGSPIEATDVIGEALDCFTGRKIVKLHPKLLQRRLCEVQINDLLAASEATGTILYICTYFPGRGGYLEDKESLDRALHAHYRQPRETPVILAHAGGAHFLEYFELSRHNPSLYLDCSFSLLRYEGSSVYQDMVYGINQRKRNLLFGSDWPDYSWSQLGPAISRLSVLTDSLALEEFLYLNAEGLFKHA